MPNRRHLGRAWSAAVLLAVGWAAMAGDGRRSPESDLAAPGAALYELAVTESVRSLMSKEEQAELDAEGRGPSPGPDYFWCEQCKTYHKRRTPAAQSQPGVAPAARPPSPGPDYYWCEKCKAYHLKQGAQNPPKAAPPGSPGTLTPHATPIGGQAVGARPPSPGEGYYWCEQCKTYHLRAAAPQQQGASPTVPQTSPARPSGTRAPAVQVAGGDYYYCEQCKTYHRRQPAAQSPAANLSPHFEGGSNSPNRGPLTVEGGAPQH